MLEILANDVFRVLNSHEIHPLSIWLSLYLGERDGEQEVGEKGDNWAIMLRLKTPSLNRTLDERFLTLTADLFKCFERHQLPVENFILHVQLTQSKFRELGLIENTDGKKLFDNVFHKRASLLFQTPDPDLK